MEHHVTATECHLPYGITQCYLLPDTSERIPPSPQPVRPVLDLPIPRMDRTLSYSGTDVDKVLYVIRGVAAGCYKQHSGGWDKSKYLLILVATAAATAARAEGTSSSSEEALTGLCVSVPRLSTVVDWTPRLRRSVV